MDLRIRVAQSCERDRAIVVFVVHLRYPVIRVVDTDVCSGTSRRQLASRLSIEPGEKEHLLAFHGLVVVISRAKIGPANNSMHMTRDIPRTHDGIKASCSQRAMRDDPKSG